MNNAGEAGNENGMEVFPSRFWLRIYQLVFPCIFATETQSSQRFKNFRAQQIVLLLRRFAPEEAQDEEPADDNEQGRTDITGNAKRWDE